MEHRDFTYALDFCGRTTKKTINKCRTGTLGATFALDRPGGLVQHAPSVKEKGRCQGQNCRVSRQFCPGISRIKLF